MTKYKLIMKNIFCALFFFPFVLIAQQDNSTLRWGVEGGLNLSIFRSQTENFHSSTGVKPDMYMGFFAINQFLEETDLKLSASYSRQGSYIQEKNTTKHTITIDYISFGNVWKVGVWRSIYLDVGLVLDVVINNPSVPFLNSSNLKGKIGGTFFLTNKIALELSVKESFSGIHNHLMKQIPPFDGYMSNRVFQFGLIYFFKPYEQKAIFK